ncbi:hypothetical protein [Pseudoruegeria sp. HB172150]|uniref:hypothetical protein n=1 Tax=Pseudoruegeria sp. HB172150 TaxID=2721164 RepID=UPI00155425DE|nr:hypothetical protein [Pseudoruegeria sp. HB172150]
MMLVIGLFFGAGAGFLAAASYGVTLDGHDHGAHDHGNAAMASMAHNHDTLLPVPEDTPAPEIALDLQPEGDDAWNLHILTENFRFAPEHVNTPAVPGEGHAHVYVDGVKIARVYGPWVHLASLPEGASELRVTLNANSHETLSVGDTPIDATVTLER